MTEIRHERPPNYDLIAAVLPVPEGAIFAYDNVIYVPSGGELTDALIAHEEVHFRQQGDDPDGWWDRYLTDASFRMYQELEAHRAEWRHMIRGLKDRELRHRYLMFVARKLVDPMYDGGWKLNQAMRMIRE